MPPTPLRHTRSSVYHKKISSMKTFYRQYHCSFATVWLLDFMYARWDVHTPLFFICCKQRYTNKVKIRAVEKETQAVVVSYFLRTSGNFKGKGQWSRLLMKLKMYFCGENNSLLLTPAEYRWVYNNSTAPRDKLQNVSFTYELMNGFNTTVTVIAVRLHIIFYFIFSVYHTKMSPHYCSIVRKVKNFPFNSNQIVYSNVFYSHWLSSHGTSKQPYSQTGTDINPDYNRSKCF